MSEENLPGPPCRNPHYSPSGYDTPLRHRRAFDSNHQLKEGSMSQIKIPNSSIVFDNPQQVDQSTLNWQPGLIGLAF